MEIRESKTIEDEVNRRGSKYWIMMNDNSKARFYREMHVQKYGGFFERQGKFFVWRSPIEEKNGYWLRNINTNEKTFFNNMTEFGSKHGLTPVKICELLNGKRKTYKGWTAVEIREVKDGVGSNVKAKREPKKKIKVFEGATFQNIETKEIFFVDNISEYAKTNNINSGNLYKVARGKMKSYKGLKLHNPLEVQNYDK